MGLATRAKKGTTMREIIAAVVIATTIAAGGLAAGVATKSADDTAAQTKIRVLIAVTDRTNSERTQ